MAAALRAGLSLSMSGIPFWSHDIGGFWNPQNVGRGPDPELYIRWAQWGLLSSHSRFHGVRGREPWWYGEEAVDVVRKFAKLRYRLLPYLWSFANEAAETATPLVRPLVLEYPDDPTAHHVDTQFLLGPWLLVAPVFEPGGPQKVYLPPGRWYDFWSGEALNGPCWLDLTVPLDRIPLYVRDDSLVPMGPEQSHVGERPWSPLELNVRVSSEVRLRVSGEGADIDARATASDGALALDLSGRGDLVVRFIAPRVSSVDVTGGASGVTQGTQDGILACLLSLNGAARLVAR
jgi:alpha-D-xyloside xylohydrolase